MSEPDFVFGTLRLKDRKKKIAKSHEVPIPICYYYTILGINRGEGWLSKIHKPPPRVVQMDG